MNRIAQLGVPVLALLVCAGWLIFHDTGSASSQKKVQPTIEKIAEALIKGDTKTAEKLAAPIAKTEDGLLEAMNLFKPRNRGGFGVGKEGEIQPDGIELKIKALARDGISKAKLDKEADALIEMTYRAMAINQVGALAKPYTAEDVKDWKKHWDQYNAEMTESEHNFIKAVKSGVPAMVQTAANRLDTSCNNCHTKFR